MVEDGPVSAAGVFQGIGQHAEACGIEVAAGQLAILVGGLSECLLGPALRPADGFTQTRPLLCTIGKVRAGGSGIIIDWSVLWMPP